MIRGMVRFGMVHEAKLFMRLNGSRVRAVVAS